jgi:hypoxanthine phosphoribosyltransferase
VPAQQVEREVLSWADIARLVEALCEQARGEYDLMLAITRGGLIPAGMLAYRLGLRNIVVAAVEFYDDHGRRAAAPTFLQFPADSLLRGQRVLVVDEVWDSGTTIQAVCERVRQAGGTPTTAVLHYKRARSEVEAEPDFAVAETAAWIVYPLS